MLRFLSSIAKILIECLYIEQLLGHYLASCQSREQHTVMIITKKGVRIQDMLTQPCKTNLQRLTNLNKDNLRNLLHHALCTLPRFRTNYHMEPLHRVDTRT